MSIANVNLAETQITRLRALRGKGSLTLEKINEAFNMVSGQVNGAVPGATHLLFSGKQLNGLRGGNLASQILDNSGSNIVHAIGHSEIENFLNDDDF